VLVVDVGPAWHRRSSASQELPAPAYPGLWTRVPVCCQVCSSVRTDLCTNTDGPVLSEAHDCELWQPVSTETQSTSASSGHVEKDSGGVTLAVRSSLPPD
jgi:hypothetical protein